MYCQSARSYEMNGEARLRTQVEPNTLRLGLASEHLSRLLLLVVCFADATPSQDPETMADLRNFQTAGFVDDISHWSKVLQLFFSSENEMQKLQKKTHNSTSKVRNNASFQLYAPGDDKTGNLSALLKTADSCAGLAKECVLMALTNHSFTWKDAFPLCCLSGFWIPVTGKLFVKPLALEDMRCLGLESISGLGSFLAAESSGNNDLDRLRGGAYI